MISFDIPDWEDWCRGYQAFMYPFFFENNVCNGPTWTLAKIDQEVGVV